MTTMRSPRHVDVEVTGRCNLRCRYCYRGGETGARELTTDEWRRFFDELGDAAVMSVCLAGGEPFLRADLPELAGAVRANRMRFQVVTNGALVDETAAAAIAEGGRCDYVQVSLDAGRAGPHDLFRGAGSFDAAVRGVRTLRRAGLAVTTRLTVHRGNVHALEEAVSFALEELGVASVSTNAAAALGACAGAGGAGGAESAAAGEGDGVTLTRRDRERAMEDLAALAERYPGRVTANAGPLAEARAWARMEEARRAGEPAFADGGRLSGCGCANDQLAVRADGTFIPCLLLAGIELGRVGADPLLDVWRGAPALREMRRRAEVALEALAQCCGCAYVPYCTGNCPAVVLGSGGGFEAPAPESCLRRFLEAGGRLPHGVLASAPLSS